MSDNQPGGHPAAIAVRATDFVAGESLLRESFALPHRVVTANESCVRRAVGRVSTAKLNQVREQVCAVIREN